MVSAYGEGGDLKILDALSGLDSKSNCSLCNNVSKNGD
jgi:hypothetical protein